MSVSISHHSEQDFTIPSPSDSHPTPLDTTFTTPTPSNLLCPSTSGHHTPVIAALALPPAPLLPATTATGASNTTSMFLGNLQESCPSPTESIYSSFPRRQTMTPVNLPPIDDDPDNAVVLFSPPRRPRFSSFRSDPSLRNSSHSAASTQSVPTLAQLGAYSNSNPDMTVNKDQTQNNYETGRAAKENKDEHKIKPSKEVEKSGPPIHMIIAGPVNDSCMAGMPPMMGVGTRGMSRENCILQSFLAPPDVIFDSAPPSRPISEALKHNSSMPDLTELADYNNNRTSSYSTTSSSSSNLAPSIASRRPSPLGLQPPTTGPVDTAAVAVIDTIPSSDGMVQRMEQQQQLGHSPVRPEHDLQNRLRLGSHYDKVPSPTRKRAKSSARVKEKDRERKTSGFYRVMSFGRKSMSDLRGSASASASASGSNSDHQSSEAPPVPRLPTNVGNHKSPFPGMPPASTMDDSPYALLQPFSGQLFPSTPMSSRSSTQGTRLSSGSSAMSSEGLHTPMTADMSNQGSNPGVPISSVNLQNALRQAEKQQGGGGRERTKSIGKWISGLGRRSNKSQKSKSGASTPALLSGLPSRIPSALDLGLLAREVSPTMTSGPPDIPLPPTPTIVIRPETILIENESQSQGGPENESATSQSAQDPDHVKEDQRPYAVEMMRKKSIGKLREARRPSPHPLAVALRRQSLQIPDDLSSALQAGTRVFPNSVNSPQVADTISPAHVGLWPSVAVKSVLINLDNGDVPLEAVTPSRDHSEGSSTTATARPGVARRQTALQPRGVADFINRPPFEDRNVVYYGSEAWSPVSMARPGQAVESIEHSQYMLALSEADTVQTPWTVIPRASVGGMDDITRVNPPARAYTAPAAYSGDQRPVDHRARDSEIASVEAIDFGRVSPGFQDSEESAETTLDRLSRLLASEPEHLNEIIDSADSGPSSFSDESADPSTATTATSSSSYETGEDILQVKNLDDEDAPLAMVLKKFPKPNGPRQPKFSSKKVEPSNSTNMKLNLRIAADKAKKAKSAELGTGVGTPVDYVRDLEGEVTETRDQWRDESSERRALAEELNRQQEELQRYSQYQYPQPQPRHQMLGEVGSSSSNPQRPHLRSRSTSQVPQFRDHLIENRTKPAEPHHSTSYTGVHPHAHSKYTTPEHTPTKSPKRYTSYYTSPTRSTTQSRRSTSNAWAATLGQGHYQGMPMSQGAAGPGPSGYSDSSGRRPQPIVLPPRIGLGPQRESRHL